MNKSKEKTQKKSYDCSTGYKDPFNTTYQFNVTFSEETLSCINNDIHIFSTQGNTIKKNTLLNIIINNYAGNSPVDISNCISEQIQIIKDMLGCCKYIDEDTKTKIQNSMIDKLIEAKKKEYNSKIKGKQERFTVNKNELPKLRSLNVERYYKVTKYLSRLFEAYAKLDLAQREKIVFLDNYKIIQNAIKNNLSLNIQNYNGDRFYVRPYKLVVDKFTNYNYLIGYSSKNDNEGKIASLRLSRMLRVDTDANCHLTDQEKENIDNAVKEKGAAYLIGEIPKGGIKVALTPLGEDLYYSIQYNRPIICEKNIDGNKWNIYKFNCTIFQAKTYFIKLGKEVKIIEPLELKEYFKKFYEEALSLYM